MFKLMCEILTSAFIRHSFEEDGSWADSWAGSLTVDNVMFVFWQWQAAAWIWTNAEG